MLIPALGALPEVFLAFALPYTLFLILERVLFKMTQPTDSMGERPVEWDAMSESDKQLFLRTRKEIYEQSPQAASGVAVGSGKKTEAASGEIDWLKAVNKALNESSEANVRRCIELEASYNRLFTQNTKLIEENARLKDDEKSLINMHESMTKSRDEKKKRIQELEAKCERYEKALDKALDIAESDMGLRVPLIIETLRQALEEYRAKFPLEPKK